MKTASFNKTIRWIILGSLLLAAACAGGEVRLTGRAPTLPIALLLLPGLLWPKLLPGPGPAILANATGSLRGALKLNRGANGRSSLPACLLSGIIYYEPGKHPPALGNVEKVVARFCGGFRATEKRGKGKSSNEARTIPDHPLSVVHAGAAHGGGGLPPQDRRRLFL